MKIILSVFVAFFSFTSMAHGQMFTEKQRKFEYTLSLDEPANVQIDFQFPTLKKLPNYNPYMSKPSLYITGEDPGRDSRSDHNFMRHTYENITNNDLTRLNLPLKAGRYHVRLQYPNSKEYLNLPFDFKMTKVKGAFEQEPNNGWGTANLLIEDEVYTGYMQMKDGGNDSDFFELVVEESGILELSFTTAEKPINGRPYFGNHELYFYDGSLAIPNERMNYVIMRQKPAKGVVRKRVGLKKGTYFVVVKHYGNNGVTNQEYTIGYTFTPTQLTEIELNRKPEWATPITTDGQFYQGRIEFPNNPSFRDYYSFEVNEEAEIVFTLKQLNYNKENFFAGEILNGKKQQVQSFKTNEQELANTLNLQPGKYFLCVRGNTSYERQDLNLLDYAVAISSSQKTAHESTS